MFSKRDSHAILCQLGGLHHTMFRKARKSGNPHQEAVTRACAVAYNYVQSILAGELGGSAAFAMCRTLFEITCSVAYLAKQRGELQDFQDFGRMMEDDLRQAFGQKADPKIGKVRDHLEEKWRSKHDGRALHKGRDPTWHGHTIKELAKSLGLLPEGVKEFYARSSQATHGDSVIALAIARGQPEVVEYLSAAPQLAIQLLGYLFETVNTALRFGLDSDLDLAKGEIRRLLQ